MQKHYFDGPAVADEYSKGCSAEPSTGATAAAAASQKSCFVVQSTDLIAWL